jgi:hypothetical protein
LHPKALTDGSTAIHRKRFIDHPPLPERPKSVVVLRRRGSGSIENRLQVHARARNMRMDLPFERAAVARFGARPAT